MFLELLNNAVLDSSFFYMYFGMFLVSSGVMYLLHSHHIDAVIDEYFLVDKHQNIKINRGQLKEPLLIHEPFVVWLVKTCKRIDEKDDKEDDSHSYFKSLFKIRGGEIWKRTQCSPFYINIDI